MENDKDLIESVTNEQYKYGFVTDVETDLIEKGLNEDVICRISEMKQEPEWLREFRLNAYRKFLKMEMPEWAHLNIPPINLQDIIYYAAPKKKKQLESLDEVDPAYIGESRRYILFIRRGCEELSGFGQAVFGKCGSCER